MNLCSVLCAWQAIKQHPSALQLYREKLGKEGMVSKEQVSLLTLRMLNCKSYATQRVMCAS